MPKSPRSNSQDVPATERLYLVPNGDASVVIRGWPRAEQFAKALGVTTCKVKSLRHAHGMLVDLYGHIPDTALQVTGRSPSATLAFTPASAPAPPAANDRSPVSAAVRRSLPWLRIETEDGAIDKTVTDPEQIEGLKALRLWP